MFSCCGESEGKGKGGVRGLLREMKGVDGMRVNTREEMMK